MCTTDVGDPSAVLFDLICTNGTWTLLGVDSMTDPIFMCRDPTTGSPVWLSKLDGTDHFYAQVHMTGDETRLGIGTSGMTQIAAQSTLLPFSSVQAVLLAGHLPTIETDDEANLLMKIYDQLVDDDPNLVASGSGIHPHTCNASGLGLPISVLMPLALRRTGSGIFKHGEKVCSGSAGNESSLVGCPWWCAPPNDVNWPRSYYIDSDSSNDSSVNTSAVWDGVLPRWYYVDGPSSGSDVSRPNAVWAGSSAYCEKGSRPPAFLCGGGSCLLSAEESGPVLSGAAGIDGEPLAIFDDFYPDARQHACVYLKKVTFGLEDPAEYTGSRNQAGETSFRHVLYPAACDDFNIRQQGQPTVRTYLPVVEFEPKPYTRRESWTACGPRGICNHCWGYGSKKTSLAMTKTVDCSANSLIVLPSFDNVPVVKVIRLSLNSITLVGPSVFGNQLYALQELIFNDNYLTEVPAITNPTLAELDLSGNRISIIGSQVFTGVPNLEGLVLKRNPITALRANAFAGLKSLVRLEMARTTVFDLSAVVFGPEGPPASLQSGGICGGLDCYSKPLNPNPAGVHCQVRSTSEDVLFLCECTIGIDARSTRSDCKPSGCCPAERVTECDSIVATTSKADLPTAGEAADTAGFPAPTVAGATCGAIAVAIAGIILLRRRNLLRKSAQIRSDVAILARTKAHHAFLEQYSHLLANEVEMSSHVVSFERLSIDFDRLVEGPRIGPGSFGPVFEGIIRRSRKQEEARLKVTDRVEVDALSACLLEGHLLCALVHPNIEALLAVVSDSAPMVLALEPASCGTLLQFLKDCRPAALPRKATLGSAEQLSLARGAAAGCEFLESKRVIHRAISAENLIVTAPPHAVGSENEREFPPASVKLSNFGQSRDVYMSQEYVRLSEKRLSIRWMAPESLTKGLFSSKSDVWAFGVLMWEIFSLGRTPYGALKVREIGQEVAAGRRLEPPSGCPRQCAAAMKRCWITDYFRRPSFADLVADLALLALPGSNDLQLCQERARHGGSSRGQSEEHDLEMDIPRLALFPKAESDLRASGFGTVVRVFSVQRQKANLVTSFDSIEALGTIASDAVAADRLASEFLFLKHLNHDNILPIVGMCSSPPLTVLHRRPALGTLEEALAAESGIAAGLKGARIGLDIGLGLEYLHCHQLVHGAISTQTWSFLAATMPLYIYICTSS